MRIKGNKKGKISEKTTKKLFLFHILKYRREQTSFRQKFEKVLHDTSRPRKSELE